MIDLANPVNYSDPINRGLVAWWIVMPGRQGGGGLRWRDISKTRAHGTFAGSLPAWRHTTQRPGGWGALDFAGATDTGHVTVASSVVHSLPTGPFAISFWAYAASYAIGPAAVSWYGTDDLVIYPYDNNVGNGVRVFWRDVTTIINENTATRTGWNWFCLTSRGTTDHEFFVNGVSIGTSSTSSAGAGPFSGFSIGAFGEDTIQDFSGLLDDVRLLNHGLSDNEAMAHYQASKLGYPTQLNRIRPARFVQAAAGSPIGAARHYYAQL